MRLNLQRIALAALPLLLVGCGGGNDTYNPSLTGGKPDFSLRLEPSTQTIIAGRTATYTVTAVAANGFSQSVSLSLGGKPADGTASFAPAAIVPTLSGAKSTLTVGTTTSTSPSTYSLTVTATAGGITHTASAALVVEPSAGRDFSIPFTGSGSITAADPTGPLIEGGPWRAFREVRNLGLSGSGDVPMPGRLVDGKCVVDTITDVRLSSGLAWHLDESRSEFPATGLQKSVYTGGSFAMTIHRVQGGVTNEYFCVVPAEVEVSWMSGSDQMHFRTTGTVSFADWEPGITLTGDTTTPRRDGNGDQVFTLTNCSIAARFSYDAECRP